MNDIRRAILWLTFALSSILLWDQWQISQGHKATFFPAPSTATKAGASPAASNTPTPGALGSNGAANLPPPAAQLSSTLPPAAAVAQSTQPKEQQIVKTDVLTLTFDTEGGSLVRAVLNQHVAGTATDSGGFVLLDQSADRLYVAQSGLIGGANGPLPNHKTVMTLLPGARELAPGQDQLEVKFESAVVGGVKLLKTYTLKRGAYNMAVHYDVVNTTGAPVSPQLYVQLVRDGNKLAGESYFYSTFTGPAVYTEAKKYQKIEFTDIENNKVSAEKQATNGYVAMVQHYFASAWILPDGIKRELFLRKVDANLYAVGMITSLENIAAGATKSIALQLFVGPQEEKKLTALAPGLELVKDYGWLTILAKPLYWLLDQLHSVLSNWGWAIVALVLLLKVAFYWLNAKAYASMAKMKALTPKITELRERLKDKPQEMQLAMMKVYREEKVNPMGGCLPIMVQIPVFIALYWVLLSSVEMRHAPWVLWIKDLSAPDPYFILPLLMTLTTMLQTALNPTPPDPLQAKMMWFMPLIFSGMFFFFPAGLVLYWITNNILSIAQQWVINTRLGVPPEFNLPFSKK